MALPRNVRLFLLAVSAALATLVLSLSGSAQSTGNATDAAAMNPGSSDQGPASINANAAGAGLPAKPNIVLIVTDDQRLDSLWAMNNVKEHLIEPGTKFSQGFVVNSICCPSRTSILTGQYSHSTGVYRNGSTHGGFGAFDDSVTIATQLDAAGYRTGFFGKYLNHYKPESYIPPGWDSWGALVSGSDGKYYNFNLSVDGVRTSYGKTAKDYSTTVYDEMATDFIASAPANVPLFLEIAPSAPHGAAVPAPGDQDAYQHLSLDSRPNFNEADVSDKPRHIRQKDLLSDGKIRRARVESQNVYGALVGVDRMVGHVVKALEDSGRLENTMIVYLTDNGNLQGEHRWAAKSVPYEEAIRTPLVVRYDPLTSGELSGAMALNIDLAPTFAEIAGTTMPGADGRSLVPVLEDPEATPWRHDFLIEHMQFLKEGNSDEVPTYCALRTKTSLYVVYATGEQELYDLVKDPFEMRNLASVKQLDTILPLRERLAELCNPLPPKFPGALLSSSAASLINVKINARATP